MQIGNVSVMTVVAGEPQTLTKNTNMKNNYRNSTSSGMEGTSADYKSKIDINSVINQGQNIENRVMPRNATAGLLVVGIGAQKP